MVKEAIASIPIPKDGKDGIGFKDMSLEFDGERTFTFKFVLEDRIEEKSITVPFLIYRGIWQDGKTYQQGDTVTRDGCMFAALCDTNKQPGTGTESGWQLSTKKGRDGSRGPEGKQGRPGRDGRDGMDLTQMGPDGSKWR